MVMMAFHGDYPDSVPEALLRCDFFEPGLHSRDIEYLPAVPWTEHEMIIQHGHGSFCT